MSGIVVGLARTWEALFRVKISGQVLRNQVGRARVKDRLGSVADMAEYRLDELAHVGRFYDKIVGGP